MDTQPLAAWVESLEFVGQALDYQMRSGIKIREHHCALTVTTPGPGLGQVQLHSMMRWGGLTTGSATSV